MPQTPSTRWCPTPEQLMILEEMYRSGIRTPNASQIQHITAHLSFYGKIEGKNVFYWFQNHKARDRQKLRRKISRHHQLLIHGHANAGSATSPTAQFHSLEDQTAVCLSPTSPGAATPLHFLTHQGGAYDQGQGQGLNLLSKLDTSYDGIIHQTNINTNTNTSSAYNWMTMMMDCNKEPPKTLDLFPTKSSGLKDECGTSISSSCSTSTN